MAGAATRGDDVYLMNSSISVPWDRGGSNRSRAVPLPKVSADAVVSSGIIVDMCSVLEL